MLPRCARDGLGARQRHAPPRGLGLELRSSLCSCQLRFELPKVRLSIIANTVMPRAFLRRGDRASHDALAVVRKLP
jgi:hypothetical protein